MLSLTDFGQFHPVNSHRFTDVPPQNPRERSALVNRHRQVGATRKFLSDSFVLHQARAVCVCFNRYRIVITADTIFFFIKILRPRRARLTSRSHYVIITFRLVAVVRRLPYTVCSIMLARKSLIGASWYGRGANFSNIRAHIYINLFMHTAAVTVKNY